MGFLFVFCSNKSKTVPGQVGGVVVQRPSDGANSRVTSRLILQPHYVLLHRPSWSAQAGVVVQLKTLEPGKKVPARGQGQGHLWQDTERNGRLQGEGRFHHTSPELCLQAQTPAALCSGPGVIHAFNTRILILCWDAGKKGDRTARWLKEKDILIAITAVKMV